METLKIEFQPNLKSKIIELLSIFSKDELKISDENSAFQFEKHKLKLVSDKIDNGTARFCSFEELDESLENVISEYEN